MVLCGAVVLFGVDDRCNFQIDVSFAETEEERIVREFSLLVDAHEAYADSVIDSSLGAFGKVEDCLLLVDGFPVMIFG